jgi:hypothetical protein
MRTLFTLSLSIVFSLAGCGTYSPIPAHGGGKRFAVEQALISAAMRSAISDIPITSFRDKKVYLQTAIINDEGGGAMGGGRPYASEQMNLLISRGDPSANLSGSPSRLQLSAGVIALRGDNSYIKDIGFNNSDSRQFGNLLASYLIRNNVMINPEHESEGDPDYFLEIIVDVLGSWRSRTDWLITNKEELMAVVSLEYVITPVNQDKTARQFGRIAYEATFTEKYVAWMGPTKSGITVSPSSYNFPIPTFGEGTNTYTNLRRNQKSVEFKANEPTSPVLINPKMR